MAIYYVTIPANNVKGTVFESEYLTYTPNLFVLRQYLENTLPKLSETYEYELYQYDTSDEKELFQRVKEDTGYELNQNRQLELWESVNNPQYAFCATAEFIDDAGEWDYLFNIVELLYRQITDIQVVINILRLPRASKKAIDILLNKYCFLCGIFMYNGILYEIENVTLRGEIEKALATRKNADNEKIKYFSITDLIDTALVLYHIYNDE